MNTLTNAPGEWLAPGLLRLQLPLVNVALLGEPGGEWVLVDAGVPGSAGAILRAARHWHGERPPSAVVLTHGHLDHIGALRALLKHWRVPVYAHVDELPMLSGEVPYPFPDPTVGGTMSLLSPAFVPGPFDFRPQLRPLPPGELPHAPGWQWVHTPGHTTGHVSLWRGSDRSLIVGDAFVTTAQESVRGALLLRPVRVQGPPAYYTPNWAAARESVRALAALRPGLALSGHGHPLSGETLARQLATLAADFDRSARPRRGWYLRRPQPQGRPHAGGADPLRRWVLGGLAALAGAWWLWRR